MTNKKYEEKTERVGITVIPITERGLPDREVICMGCKSPVIIKPLAEYNHEFALFWAGVCPKCFGLSIRGPTGLESAITKEEKNKIRLWLMRR